MTDKIEKIRAALKGATPGPWWSHCDDDSFCFRVRQWTDPSTRGPYDNGKLICDTRPPASGPQNAIKVWMAAVNPPFCKEYFDARLIALAPDMARIALAADRLANSVSDTADEHTPKLVMNYLAGYRAAVKGKP